MVFTVAAFVPQTRILIQLLQKVQCHQTGFRSYKDKAKGMVFQKTPPKMGLFSSRNQDSLGPNSSGRKISKSTFFLISGRPSGPGAPKASRKLQGPLITQMCYCGTLFIFLYLSWNSDVLLWDTFYLKMGCYGDGGVYQQRVNSNMTGTTITR